MALTDPGLTPRDGRTVTYGDGSSTELKGQGEQPAEHWADDGATDRPQVVGQACTPAIAYRRRNETHLQRAPNLTEKEQEYE